MLDRGRQLPCLTPSSTARVGGTSRNLVAETRLDVRHLVAPLFVREGIDEPQPIASLPGVVQHTRDSLRAEVKRAGRSRHRAP